MVPFRLEAIAIRLEAIATSSKKLLQLLSQVIIGAELFVAVAQEGLRQTLILSNESDTSAGLLVVLVQCCCAQCCVL